MRNTTILAFVFFTFYISNIGLSERLNLADLQKMLERNNASWQAGETNISRLPEEIKRRMFSKTIYKLPEGPNTFRGGIVGALPSKLDYRNYNGKNFVTPIKYQEDCGACWAFASVAAMESKYLLSLNKSYNNMLDLSEQILVSCNNFGGGCNGGYLEDAANFLKNYGTYDESCYTYRAADTSCNFACDFYGTYAYKISSYQRVSQSVNALKEAVYTYGPIPVAMIVYEDFEYYQGGVYKYQSGRETGAHAVLIVGWDDSQSCFIVKNSFSTSWGEGGYFRIAYSEVNGYSDFGYNAVALGNITNSNYVQAMLSTDPGGKRMKLDNISITTPVIYSFPKGSSHTVNISSTFTESDQRTRYVFDNRSDGKGINDNVVIPSSDTSVLWSYKTQYLIKTSVNNTSFGRVDPDCSSGCWNDYWKTVTFTAIPLSGYQFKNWSGDLDGNTNPIKFLVTSPLTLTANFEVATVKTYTITATAGPGGKITPSGTVYVAEHGSHAFDITADSGYSIEDVLVDNKSIGAVNRYVFSDVTANHTIYAKFVSNTVTTYSIYASASIGGKIQPSGKVVVRKGASQTFTISADTGFRIDTVMVDGKSVGGVSSYTFNNVVSNHSISASFIPQGQDKEYVKLSIKYSGNGEGAIMSSPAGLTCHSDCSGWFLKSSTVTLFAIPSSNSTFEGWNIAVCGKNRECSIVLNYDTPVVVYFNLLDNTPADQASDEDSLKEAVKSSGCSCSYIE